MFTAFYVTLSSSYVDSQNQRDDYKCNWQNDAKDH